jgi:hypothetical protein
VHVSGRVYVARDDRLLLDGVALPTFEFDDSSPACFVLEDAAAQLLSDATAVNTQASHDNLWAAADTFVSP